MSSDTTCHYCGWRFESEAALAAHAPCPENVTDVHPDVIARVQGAPDMRESRTNEASRGAALTTHPRT